MSAFNVVRFRVKPELEGEIVDAHRKANVQWPGFVRGDLVNTGKYTYCFVGEWLDMKSLADARPMMISVLDSFRHTLEDLGGDLGLSDPVSGESVVQVKQEAT